MCCWSLENEDKEQEQTIKLDLWLPWVQSVSDFIFLALAYESGWPFLSLTVSSSHWQCAVSVLISWVGIGGSEIFNQISALVGIWTSNLSIGSPAL